MRCALCGGVAVEEADPRMPLLRIPSCWRCRGIIAYGVGWARNWNVFRSGDGVGCRFWSRRGVFVAVPV